VTDAGSEPGTNPARDVGGEPRGGSEPGTNPSGRAPPTRAHRVLSVWRRHVAVYTRSFVSNATPAVFEPVLLLLSVGLGVGKHVATQFNDLPYDAYMAPGILASATLYTASWESTYGTFIRHRFQGTYEAMLASPLTVRDIVMGELLWAASKGVLFSTIVGLVLAALGFVATPWALAIPLFGFVNSLAFAGLGLAVSSRVKSIEHLQLYFTLALTPMVFFSGFMFPVAQLPGPLPTIARSLPMYHAVETFRLLARGPAHVSTSWSWACPIVLVGFAVALAVVGGLSFERRMLRDR
jgi:lipooligosaccharide transport system permease protein